MPQYGTEQLEDKKTVKIQAAYKVKEEIELQHEERGEILVQPWQHANVWFIYWFMRRNLIMFIETLPTQKPCFFPIKALQRLNTADVIESDFCEQLRISRDHIAGCLTVQQAAWASAGVQFVWTVLIMLLIIVPATVFCLILSPTPSPQFQFKVQANTFFGKFGPRALTVSPAWFIASVQEFSALKYREKMLFITLWDDSLPKFF